MSIPVVCPNGHSLRAQDALAGRSGLCPVCKAPVKVPLGDQREVSEDSILDFLSSQSAGQARGRQRTAGVPAKPPSEAHVPAGHSPPKKSCGRCNREIPAQTHICPFCHAYVGGLSGV
jgi:hypothetical protein